jgi:cytochrome c oxidase subunit 2
MRYAVFFEKTRALVFALAVAAAALAACGGGEAESTLSPRAEAGLLTAQGLGCAACHGLKGQGIENLGPSWQGLFGTDVTLVDGTVARVDRDYLVRSILEPDAELVSGFTLPMPPYTPEPDQLNSLLDYLMEVG